MYKSELRSLSSCNTYFQYLQDPFFLHLKLFCYHKFHHLQNHTLVCTIYNEIFSPNIYIKSHNKRPKIETDKYLLAQATFIKELYFTIKFTFCFLRFLCLGIQQRSQGFLSLYQYPVFFSPFDFNTESIFVFYKFL